MSIPSYRDPELRHTLNDIISKARYPANIFVGVFNQVDINDKDCIVKSSTNIRVDQIPYNQSKGVCWARHHILSRLRQNETYTLCIDSHSRFVLHWDHILLEMFHSLPSKSVISHYPPNYVPPNKLAPDGYYKPCFKHINDKGIPVIGSSAHLDKPIYPEITPFYAGGMAFTRSNTFDEVPYDPHLYFHGEEITMATRLYTHGYDIYVPNNTILYHRYNTEDNNKDPRRLHWQDHHDWGGLEDVSVARIKHVLNIQPCTLQRALIDIKKYSLGNVRTLESYENLIGHKLRPA